MAPHAPLPHRCIEVVERQNGMNTGQGHGGARVNGVNRCVGMGTPDEARMEEIRRVDIIDKASLSSQQRLVLNSRHALSDQIFCSRGSKLHHVYCAVDSAAFAAISGG